MGHTHFKGESPLQHIATNQAEGVISYQELHGFEVSGSVNAATDAARDIALTALLLFTLMFHTTLPQDKLIAFMSFFLIGLVIWKGGRAAWLGWMRLERLHRIMSQEKWEIEHNRPTEREELLELYSAKGFEGKLLEEVVNVLMADESRLLKVMIEEEMRLSLGSIEHPLKQGAGALLGASISTLLILASLIVAPYTSYFWTLPLTALTLVGITSSLAARHSENRSINAIVWSVGLALLAWSATYFAAGWL